MSHGLNQDLGRAIEELQVRLGRLRVGRAPGDRNTGDIGTKKLDAQRMGMLLRLAGLRLVGSQGQRTVAAVIV